MTHRFRRSRRTGASASSLFDQVVDLSASRPLFHFSRYQLDGVSGKPDRFFDYNNPAHYLFQSNSARQIAVPAPRAAMGNAVCGDFNANGLYISNLPAASWLFPQDGSGCSIYVTVQSREAVASANRFICGTFAGAGIYMLMLFATGTSNVRLELSRAAGIIYNQAAATSNNAVYLSYHFSNARNPDVLFQLKGATANESDTTAPPDAGAPTGPLLVGANPGFGNLGMFFIHSIMCFPLLDASGRSVVESYLLSETGITP